MQYFIDITTSDPKIGDPELITLGIKASDGRELEIADSPDMGEAIEKFCDPRLYGVPEFWVYDETIWMVIQEATPIPALPPGYCDLKSFAEDCGNPTLPAKPPGAIGGARWTQDVWGFLSRYTGEELAQDREDEPEPPPARQAPKAARSKK